MIAKKASTVKRPTLSLTPALHRGGWLESHAGHFTPEKETRYLLYRRLDGPQDRSGRARKISLPHRDSIPEPSQNVASRYTD